MTIRSSVLDRTCPNPNFKCSTWAPWEYVLEAIEFLRFTPRMYCWRCDVPAWNGMDGAFGQLYHSDDNDVSKSGAICRARRKRCQAAQQRAHRHTGDGRDRSTQRLPGKAPGGAARETVTRRTYEAHRLMVIQASPPVV